jgi:hypothetical protein
MISEWASTTLVQRDCSWWQVQAIEEYGADIMRATGGY